MLGVYGAASHVKCFRDKHTVRVFPLNKYTGTGSAGIDFGVCRERQTCSGSAGKRIEGNSPHRKNGIQEKIEHAGTNPVKVCRKIVAKVDGVCVCVCVCVC